MKTGIEVKIKKDFDHGIVTFEKGDILKVANYIHKSCVYLKHDRVIDLVKIPYSEMDDYIEEIVLVMPNYCPYCGSDELYDPNPTTDPLGPYCADCGKSIEKVPADEKDNTEEHY